MNLVKISPVIHAQIPGGPVKQPPGGGGVDVKFVKSVLELPHVELRGRY